MSDNQGHAAPTTSPFTEADWKAFQKDDILAGSAVVVLMTAIFSIGVILYTIVLIAVMS